MEKLKILVLEDNHSDAELVKYHASTLDFDCEFRHANSRESFLETLENFIPDIILSDYNLNGYTGMQALEHCFSIFPNMPFIIVTGTLGDELAVKIIKDGANDFVLKKNLTQLPMAIIRALRETEEKRQKLVAEYQLKDTLTNLEILVEERTRELSEANKALKDEVMERILVSRKLQERNKEITDNANQGLKN